jgi:hypothetical protein
MFGKSKKKKPSEEYENIEDADEDELDESEDVEEQLDREELNVQNPVRKKVPIQSNTDEPSPLSKQEVGDLISTNLFRLQEFFKYYQNMR